MQTGHPDALADVDADPAAVFEAHDADTVEELLAGGSEPSTGPSDDVGALFADGLEEPTQEDRVERSRATDESREPGGVLDELARVARASETDDGAARDGDDAVVEASDAEVEAALEAAEEVYDGEVPDEIPFE